MEMNMQDMVAALATMPEDKRKTMMTERLDMFYGMPEEQRKQGMSGMIQAVGALSDADQRKLVKTRTECLCDFSDEKRNALMGAHMGILQSLGEQARMKEMQTIQSIVPELSPENQAVVKGMMEKMQHMGHGH